MARWMIVALVSVAMLAGGWAKAGQPSDDLIELRLKAVVTIGADGRITALEWVEDREPVLRLARMVEPSVLQLEFEPGQVDGAPVVTRTTLSLVVHVTGTDEHGLSASVAKASTGIGAVLQTPIPYPADAARAGQQAEVWLDIAIDAAGEVAVEDAVYTGTSDSSWVRKQFIAAASKGVSAWRYRVEELDGRPMPTRTWVTVTFCLDKRPAWCDGSERTEPSPSGEALPRHP